MRPDRGFTLVELLAALALTAVLLTALNAMLFSLSRQSARQLEASTAARRLEFTLETLRKELGEAGIATGDTRLSFMMGRDAIAYATSRLELIGRDEMPRGLIRVEWRFDAARGALERVATPIGTLGAEDGRPLATRMLEGVLAADWYVFEKGVWRRITGSLTPVSPGDAVRLDLTFAQETSPLLGDAVSCAFAVPR